MRMGALPEDVDGNTPEERIKVFAERLSSQSERLFPSIAFTAEVKRSNQHRSKQNK